MKTKSAYRLVRTGSRAAYLLAGSIAALLAAGTAPLARAATWDETPENYLWDTVSKNWNTAQTWSNYSDATFGGTTGSTITLNEAGIIASSLNFNTTGYTITRSSTNNLTLNGNITVAADVTATISAPVTLPNYWHKYGTGTLILSSTANVYNGYLYIDEGILRTGADNVLNGAVIGDGYQGIGNNGGPGATLDLNNHDDTVTALALGTGSSGTVMTGTGTLTFVGTDPNQVAIGADSGSVSKLISGKLNLGSASRIFLNRGPVFNIMAAITGDAGSGITFQEEWFRLAGANTYDGDTFLNYGKIQIGVGNDGTVGSITSSAIGKGNLVFHGGRISSDGATDRTILNPVSFINGDTNATLGDATNNGKLTFAATMDLGANWSNHGITLNSDVEFTGKITCSDHGRMYTMGSGTLTLNNAAFSNDFQEIGAAENSTVRWNLDDQVADTAGLTLSNNGTLNLNGHSDSVGFIYFGGGDGSQTATLTTGVGTLTVTGAPGGNANISSDSGGGMAKVISGKLSMGGGMRTIGNNGSGPMTIAADITNGGLNMTQGTITVTGKISDPLVGDPSSTMVSSGTLILSGQNTYTGVTTLTSGVIQLGAGETPATPSGPLGVGGDIFFNGGTLRYSPANQYDYSSRFTGDNFRIDTNAQSVAFDTVLLGNLVKLGTGTLTLNATLGTGDTYGSGGTLITGAANVLSTRGHLIIGSNTSGLDAAVTLGGNDSMSKALVLGHVGWHAIATAGTKSILNTGANTLTLGKGDWNDRNDISIWYGYTNGQLAGGEINGKISLGSLSRDFMVVKSSSPGVIDLTIAADISGAAGSGIILNNTRIGGFDDVGTLFLSGTNSYDGGTRIDRGVLIAAKPESLPGYNTSGKVTVASGATLACGYGGGSDWISADITTLLSNNGTGFASGSSLGLDTTNAASGASFDPSPMAGRSLGLNKLGTHTLTLTGASTYAGGTIISAGTLSVSADNNLGTGGLTLANGATLLTTASFASNRGVTLGSGGGAFAQAIGTTLTLSGTIDGSGTLMQSGPGTLAVHGGNNSLTVPIQVNGGTLDLGSFNQTVSSISGTGTISGSGTLTLKVTIPQTITTSLGGSINLDVSPELRNDVEPLLVTAANATTGSLTIDGGGDLYLERDGYKPGLTLKDSGAFANATAINIRNGTLTFDNTGTTDMSGRVKATAPVTMDSGSILFRGGAASGSTSTEFLGAMALNSGVSNIRVENNSGGAQLTLASLTRSTGAMVNVVGDNLGQTGDRPRVLITAALSDKVAPINGVVPGVFSSSFGDSWNIVGYSATQGVKGLSFPFWGETPTPGIPEYYHVDNTTGQDFDAALATSNLVFGGGTVQSGGQTINSYNQGGIAFAGGSDLLRVQSGMMVIGEDTWGSTGTRGMITSGTQELFVLRRDGNANQSLINSVITDKGPLGTDKVSLVVYAPHRDRNPFVILTAENTYSGGTFVSGGAGFNNYGGLLLKGSGVAIPAGGLTINNGGLVQMATNEGQIDPSNIVTLNGSGRLNLIGTNTVASLAFNGNGSAVANNWTSEGDSNAGGSGTLKITGDITATPTSAATTPTTSIYYDNRGDFWRGVGTYIRGGDWSWYLTDNRGTLDLNNSSTHNITVNALPSDPSGIGLSILSIIQNGGFTKKGAGILELAARNTFAGQLTVEEGGLSIAEIRNVGNDQPLSNSALAVILGGTGGKTGTLIYSGSWWGWDASSDKPFTMATGGTGGFQVGTQWGNQTPITLTLSGVIDGGGGLTKTGTGTLALTNTNTYSGDTTIEDGVLSLGMRCLDDDSTLTIGTAAGSSAVLNLPNAGTDFVAALVIDGVTMPNGTYDSTNSGGAITGAGIIQVGVSTPQIVVEENSITLSSGGTVDYGAQAVSSQTDLVFTISNSGDMPLTLNGTPMVAVSGTNAANFTVITPPTSPVAGKGSTTFTLRFIPSAVGARAATLTITSDSTTDGSFTLNLTGTGTADYSEWVKAYTGDMSTGGDPDGDGVKNQQEYAFGLNPNSGTSANPIIVPFHKTTGTFSYTRRDPSLTGLGYKILISTTLQAVSWTEDTGAVQTPGPVSGGTQTVAVQLSPSLLSASKLFMRVEAVQP